MTQEDWQKFEKLVQWDELNKPIKKEEPTLFKIAGFPNYENVISNFYSYYFDVSQPHGFDNLFITSLLNLIAKESGKEFSFNIKAFNAYREVRTMKGGFIDILLTEGDIGEDYRPLEDYGAAIIIENKVKAEVYNDLADYYDSIKSSNKIGVILTIAPYKSPNKNYVSITHNMLISEVTGQAINHLLNASEKQIIIFKDFIKNLQSYYQNQQMKLEMDKHVEFFFNNGHEVTQLFKEYNNFLLHLNETIDLVAQNMQFELMNKKSSARKTSVFGLSSASLSWWVYLDEIVDTKSFLIEFWIQQDNEVVNRWKALTDADLALFKSHTNDAAIITTTTNSDTGKNVWRKIGAKKYTNLKLENLTNFQEYFDGIMKKDWLPVKEEVVRLLGSK
ncbi:PD-(D/E)XK nuclease family protein [Runella salmonicolor]|uniref:PD-(D/E)XK nuclease family protein n=1 Tax=Runella salmonicolor TaxID=2950278 RepID=A0ABT1FQK3_9BACT|nr:PD-(D/E)XK nuclease family protein [Runella salmonicolor]MCP1384060.1 PD-(D/E)XK nuclease family protein [Runella salmonicolor]